MAPGDNGPIGGYVPKVYLAIIALVLFGLLAIIFWTRFFFNKPRQKFMLVLCISTTTMCIGYIIRIPLHSNPESLGVYIITTLLVLLSPCGFLALDYMVLPRLATHLGAEDALFLKPRLIARIFVSSDVFTFLTQSAGASLTASKNPQTANTGHWIALGALIFQGVSFGIFTIMAIIFGIRMRKRQSNPDKYINMVQRGAVNGQPQLQQVAVPPTQWKVLYGAIMWTTVGILIRCIYRIVEFTQGYRGYIPTTEAFFYCLDSLPLFLAISVWAVVSPPKYLDPATKVTPNGWSQSSTP